MSTKLSLIVSIIYNTPRKQVKYFIFLRDAPEIFVMSMIRKLTWLVFETFVFSAKYLKIIMIYW